MFSALSCVSARLVKNTGRDKASLLVYINSNLSIITISCFHYWALALGGAFAPSLAVALLHFLIGGTVLIFHCVAPELRL